MKKIILLNSFLFLFAIFIQNSFAEMQFDPYASIRFYTGYQQQDQEAKNTAGFDESDTDFLLDLAANTRVGAGFKVSDKLSGKIEIGLFGSPNHKNTYLRLAYADYDFGPVKLQVGQNYPVYTLYSGSITNADAGFSGFGILKDPSSRVPQIKVSSNGAYVAFMKSSEFNVSSTTAITSSYVDELFPKVVAGYDFKNKNMMIGGGAGYVSYKIDDPLDGQDIKDGETVASYMVYAHGKMDFSPLLVQFNLGYGTNLKQFGISSNTNYDPAIKADRTVEDTNCFEGYVVLGFKAGSAATIYGGYGYSQSDNGEWDNTDTQQAYFVNAKINIDKGVFIQPEFIMKDYMEDASKAGQGSEWYAGAKFQMDLK